ncbi:Arm DNA-binding domain-containing protein [Neobacillus sp. OS1-2]|uniref:Arm DNA-binding domain-containing protein n=1 Tax=Neobacillus sp. OS1-2 TaxID=3070680 RepID=UPI0027E06EB0|nr:Arm DNA-binding domain-containing protein [Neobacillus sp. OS1-2]WML37939.1 Arm DNA-binding domain-containing protein [Neobacillus sp. OS1-2]
MKSRIFSVRQRNERWEYRIETEQIDGKRMQITKCGFETKEAAIQAASDYIENHVHHVL